MKTPATLSGVGADINVAASNVADVSTASKSLREKWPDAFDDGTRCGFLDECPGDRELGGYPKGYQPGVSASLTWALTLRERGLPCFPCRADKRPATPRGFKDATCDHNVVHELWMRYPGPLIGIPAGEISGLDILDIDLRHGGDAVVRRAQESPAADAGASNS